MSRFDESEWLTYTFFTWLEPAVHSKLYQEY